ncbi:hypothetical protein H6F61_00995 [Cyanobacteria bacterium FACHB-472]|nr:hypothetical protein [Cyanobacteria bacterium FACHB-472]
MAKQTKPANATVGRLCSLIIKASSLWACICWEDAIASAGTTRKKLWIRPLEDWRGRRDSFKLALSSFFEFEILD